jgi:ribonuclease I
VSDLSLFSFCSLYVRKIQLLNAGPYRSVKGVFMAKIATRIAAFAALLLAVSVDTGTAQDRRQNERGRFDFCALSLSWSPSFCDAATERSAVAFPRI